MNQLDSWSVWAIGVLLVTQGIVEVVRHVARHRCHWRQAITSPRACVGGAATVFGLCLVLTQALGERAVPAQLIAFSVVAFALLVSFAVTSRLPQSSRRQTLPVSSDWLRFSGTTYEAYIAPHGGLVSLRALGQEFLEPHLTVPGGAFFYQGRPLELPIVTQPEDNVVLAERDSASVRYDFLPNSITLTAHNGSVAPLRYIIWFHHLTRLMLDGNGAMMRPPVVRETGDCAWFIGRGKVRIRGHARLCLPSAGSGQMWAADIASGQTLTMALEIGMTSEEEDLAAESWGALYPRLRRAA